MMRVRTLLFAGSLLVIVRCTGDGTHSNDGGNPNVSGEGGEAGDGASGRGGSEGGASHGGISSGAGGASRGGSLGDAGSAAEAGSVGQSGSSGDAGSSADAGAAGYAGAAGSAGTGGSSGRCGDAGGDAAAGAGGQADGPDTVSGHVRFGSGLPVPCVRIGIDSATTTTDANGFFRIPNVAPVYDVTMVSSEYNYVLVVRGVSTRTLRLTSPAAGGDRGASIAGVVRTAGGAPLPADRHVLVAFRGENRAWSSMDRPSGSSYSLQTSWSEPESVLGSIYAIAFQTGVLGRATAYDGFGSKAIALSDGGMYGSPNGSSPATTIALSPVGSHTVNGSFSVPPGYDASLWFSVGPFSVDSARVPPGPYSSVLPTGITALDTVVELRTERAVGNDRESSFMLYRIDDSTTTLNLSTPPAPSQLLPVEGATAVGYDTTFSWESPPNAVSSWFSFLGSWIVRVVSTESSARLPDLRSYGIVGRPGQRESWGVISDFGVSTVEQWMELTADPDAYLHEHGRYGRADTPTRNYFLRE